MEPLRIALAQVNPTVGDLAGNRDLLAAALERARAAGAAVVVFPELALCGYPPEDLLLRPSFLRDCRTVLGELAARTAGLTALVGCPEEEAGRVYNAAAVLCAGRPAGSYRKVELPNYGVFDEKRYFAPGDAPLVLERRGFSLAVTVCEDVWVPGGRAACWARQARAGAVLNLSASPFHAGKLQERRRALAAFAAEARAPVCYCNLVGGQDELVFDGGSLALAPDGAVSASASRFDEDLLLLDLLAPGPGGGPVSVRGPRAPEPDRLGEIRAALVLGTRDFARKNGFRRAVLGLSGGIDSALVAALAVEALGPENVTAVTMPSEFTSAGTLADAGRVAAALGIELLTVPIRGVHRAYLESLASELGAEPGVAGENLQARSRGNLLMALSNARGWLVLTCGNKSETAVGYCTLYGDTAGGLAPIKDLFKCAVYELAGEINRTSGREIIPRSVIERAPTAELRPGQKDEDSLPPYAVLDPILKAYVEEDRPVEEIVAMGFDPATVAGVVRLVDRSEFKRRQSPPGVKITPRSFGRDRRLPIVNRYRQGGEQPVAGSW